MPTRPAKKAVHRRRIPLHVTFWKNDVPRDFASQVESTLEKHGAMDVGQNSSNHGCYGKKIVIASTFISDEAAHTAAFDIYLDTYDGDFHWNVSYTIDGQSTEMKDTSRTCDGTAAAVGLLVNRHFELYRSKGGQLGRLAFLQDALGVIGGIGRVLAEEGLSADGLRS